MKTKKPTKSQDSSKIRFLFDLGNGLNVTEAQLKVYELGTKPNRPQELEADVFELEMTIKDNSFYLVVATLNEVELEGKTITLRKRNIQLIATFDSVSKLVTISEQSTIASAFNFCKFTTLRKNGDINIAASESALSVAYKMKNNFYFTEGKVSDVIISPPNGLQTNSYPMFNFISNIVYYCIVSEDIYNNYLNLTSSGRSFYGGLLHMILNPFDNIKSIYKLIRRKDQVYRPSLTDIQRPLKSKDLPKLNQWTLTIKVNDSGAQNFLISGPGYMTFDKNDRAWISNNIRQGTFNSSTFVIVLESDGTPAPFSPLFGGGLLGGAFGITTDAKKENIYIGNYGWGVTDNNPEVGSISVFTHEGTAISPPNGFCNKLNRVQGMEFDSKGHLWMCSWGNQDPLTPFDAESPYPFADAPSSVVVYLNGDPDNALSFETNKIHTLFGPFSLCIDSNDHIIVANSGNGDIGSSVYKFKLNEDETAIEYVNHWDSTWRRKNGYEWFKQVNVNSKDEIFVAGTNSSRIVKLDQNLNYCGAYKTNIFGPWGITIDDQDHMYIANFGPTKTKPGKLGIAIIPAGTSTAKKGKGEIQLMNLPTGGDEVTLANGFPLYGQIVMSSKPKGKGYKTPKCYQPLMLLTGSRIDKAGNLWTLNNFKPSFYLDLKTNPGGDGMVIFIGVATPTS